MIATSPLPLPGDRFASRAWLSALEMTSKIELQPRCTFPRVVDGLGERFGDAPALLSSLENFSHVQLAGRARRYTRWALAQNLAKGEVVALLMPNRAEYLAAWLGITRMGAVVALINTNLREQALVHCLAIAGPRHIIAVEYLMPVWAEAGFK